MFEGLFPQELYHSYIVEGNPETTSGALRAYLNQQGIIATDSPDVLYQTYDSFTVDDSAFVRAWHANKGVGEGKRVCILSTKFINHEAEKSLLKMIEEPTENTHFFIVVPNALALLDTIRSRAHIVRPIGEESSAEIKRAKEFIKLSPKERIDMVADIVKSHDNDETSGGLRYDAMNLVAAIEKIVYEQFEKNRTDKAIQFSLQELARAREFLGSSGASVKMILEHLALVL